MRTLIDVRENSGEPVGRAGAVASHLLALAGPDLYQRNAFHVTGLPTNADGRAVRQRRQRFVTLADAGDDAARAALPAFGDLGDERHRIVHELLWYWEVPEPACACPGTLHAAHDDAVRRHAEVLRLEQARATPDGELDRLWGESAQRWTDLLRRAALWDHLRHRITVLGDRRMDDTTVDELRDALPRALVMPVVELAVRADEPERMARNAERWQLAPGLVADVLAAAVTPLRTSIQAAIDQSAAARRDGDPAKAAKGLFDVVPTAKRLAGLLPPDEHRSTARLLDQVAIHLNNTALELVGPPAKATDKDLVRMYSTALELIAAADQRELISKNLAIRQTRLATQPARQVRQPSAGAATAQNVFGCLLVPFGMVMGVAGGLAGGTGLILAAAGFVVLVVIMYLVARHRRRGQR
jgi:hypothetical protein